MNFDFYFPIVPDINAQVTPNSYANITINPPNIDLKKWKINFEKLPDNGTVTDIRDTPFSGTVFKYTPDSGFEGIDSMTYFVENNGIQSNRGVIYFSVGSESENMKFIGPEGGFIISKDGRAILEIPALALDKTIPFSIEVIPNFINSRNIDNVNLNRGNGDSEDIPSDRLLSYIVKIKPSGIMFKIPADLSIRCDPNDDPICRSNNVFGYTIVENTNDFPKTIQAQPPPLNYNPPVATGDSENQETDTSLLNEEKESSKVLSKTCMVGNPPREIPGPCNFPPNSKSSSNTNGYNPLFGGLTTTHSSFFGLYADANEFQSSLSTKH